MRVELCIALVLAACGAQHRGEPEGPPIATIDPHGKQLFDKLCFKCHPNGAAGLGPAINNKPLPALAIRTQIRKGVGAMPSFGHDQLGDDQVAAIAHYVQSLRRAPAVAKR
jgi:mono/diheme cytochrome c family protein